MLTYTSENVKVWGRDGGEQLVEMKVDLGNPLKGEELKRLDSQGEKFIESKAEELGESCYTRIATSENPLRTPSGGGALVLEDSSGEEWVASMKRDEGAPTAASFLSIGNGYPEANEAINVEETVQREFMEEYKFVYGNDGEINVEDAEPVDVNFEDLSGTDSVIMYFEGNPLNRIDDIHFSWEPHISGTGVQKTFKADVKLDDLIEDEIYLADWEGDFYGWERDFVLFKPSDLEERSEVECYYSSGNKSEETVDRELKKGKLQITDKSFKRYIDTENYIPGAEEFAAIRPLSVILEKRYGIDFD